MENRSKPLRAGAALLITAGFLWIHQAFTAMFLSGAYVLVLLMLGARLRRGMDRNHVWREYHVITGLADFLLGSGCMIFLFCIGSLLFGCGIRSFRLLTVIIAGFLIGFRFMELRTAGDDGKPWRQIPKETKISLEMSAWHRDHSCDGPPAGRKNEHLRRLRLAPLWPAE